jgi:hypothetical protein
LYTLKPIETAKLFSEKVLSNTFHFKREHNQQNGKPKSQKIKSKIDLYIYDEKEILIGKKSKKEMIGGGYKPSKKEGKPKKGHIHKTKEQAKSIFDDNNKRNNDVYGVTKINGLLEMDLAGLAMNRDIWNDTDPNITEDVMLLSIDVKRNPENYPEIFEEQKKIKKKDS